MQEKLENVYVFCISLEYQIVLPDWKQSRSILNFLVF